MLTQSKTIWQKCALKIEECAENCRLCFFRKAKNQQNARTGIGERESEKRCLPSNLHLRSTAHLHISRSPEMPPTLSQSVPKAPKGLVACITHLISGATVLHKAPTACPRLFTEKYFPLQFAKKALANFLLLANPKLLQFSPF